MGLLEQFTFKRYIAAFNSFAVLVHSLNIILLGIYHVKYEVDLSYTTTTFADATQNANRMSDQMFFLSKVWTKVNPITLLMANEGIALFSALLGAFNTVNSSNKKIKYYETIRRWLEFAFTASFLEVILLICLGETNVFVLFSIWLLIVVQQLFGYLIDTEETNSTHTFLYFFMAFVILGYQQIVVILKSESSVGLSDRDKVVLPTINALFYSFFGLHHWFSKASGTYSRWVNKDIGFILLSFTTKTLVVWLTFTSLKHTIETIEPRFIDYNIDWESAFNIVLFTVLPVFLVAFGWIVTIPPYDLKKGGSSSSRQPLNPAQDNLENVSYDSGAPILGANVPMLGPDSYDEHDSLL